MPSPETMLYELGELTMNSVPFAIAWHIVIGIGLVLVAAKRWRPTKRELALLLAGPALYVSIRAWIDANPFNGTLFLLFACALIVIARRTVMTEWTSPVPRWAQVIGGLGLIFAWIYPHFNEFPNLLSRLLGSPIGIIPCPTLALIASITLMAGGFGSRSWVLTVVGMSLFYALFGIFRLGVTLDLGLLLAAIALIPLARRPQPKPHSQPDLQ